MSRIFVDAHVFDSEFQGTRTFLREIYQLLARKPDLEIFMGAGNIANLRNEFGDNPNIKFVPLKSANSAKRLLVELPAVHKKHRIDFAHYQYIAPPLKNTRYIVTTHDVLFNDFPGEFSAMYRLSRNKFFGYSAKQADILTTVSEYSKQAMRRHLQVRTKPIHVIPNGVNTRFFQSFDPEISKRYLREKYKLNDFVLYVSRFEPRKNHSLLLKAFINLNLFEKGIHLVLLGHKSIPVPEFSELYNSLPIKNREMIFMSSEVNDADLSEFYKAASVFAYPSKAEGFGIPPLEAAAMKIPVVCSNTTAMEDFRFFGENHVDPLDEYTFTKRLQVMLEQGMSQDSLGKISAEIAANYSWQGSAEKLYALLRPRF